MASASLTSCFLDSTPIEICDLIGSFSDFYSRFQLLELTHKRGTPVFQQRTDEILALAKKRISALCSDKISLSIDLVKIYIRLNNTVEANGLLKDIEKRAQAQARGTKLKISILLGEMHHRLNNVAAFESIFQSIESDALAIKEESSLDRHDKFQVLLFLAYAYQRIDEADQSNRIFLIIEDLIEIISDDREKIEYLISLAETNYLLGKFNKVEEILKNAIELANKIDNVFAKIHDLKKVIIHCSKLNMKTEVESVFQKIKALTSELHFSYSKASMLVRIAEDCPMLGKSEDAIELLQEAEGIYHNIKNGGKNYMACKTSSLIELASVYIKLQNPDEAERILKDAEEIAETLSETSKSNNFLELSKLQAVLGNFDKSSGLLRNVSLKWKTNFSEKVEAIEKAIIYKNAYLLNTELF
ncbi:MAG: hypothetical protein COT84_05985 [Chlamydiae bacterium CG10_big_fil_rev_8_21_14_0_10_35_9]|nr:MAG: hypothetical protein COT84_05985 [Chlamydiae bacterium CG10_big_fil_rev_8_21_14_0_10_35_9]